MFIIDSTNIVCVCRVPGPVPSAGDTKISGHFPSFREGTQRGKQVPAPAGVGGLQGRAGQVMCGVLEGVVGALGRVRLKGWTRKSG